MLDRIGTLLKINLVELLAEAQDPQDAVSRFLEDAWRGVAQAKDAVAAAIVQERRLAKQLAQAQAQAAVLDARTDAALEAGDDAAARDLLQQKLRAERVAAELEPELLHQRQTLAEMRAAVRALETKAGDVGRRRDVVAARRTRVVAEEEMARARAQQEAAQEVVRGLGRAAEEAAVREDLLTAVREVEETSLESRLAHAREELGGSEETLTR